MSAGRVGDAPAGIDDGAEQQQLRAREGIADLDIAGGNIGNQQRLVGAGEERRQKEQSEWKAGGSQRFDREDFVGPPEQAEGHAQRDEKDDDESARRR